VDSGNESQSRDAGDGSSVKAKLDILADAMTMPHEAFRGGLERFLHQNEFEI